MVLLVDGFQDICASSLALSEEALGHLLGELWSMARLMRTGKTTDCAICKDTNTVAHTANDAEANVFVCDRVRVEGYRELAGRLHLSPVDPHSYSCLRLLNVRLPLPPRETNDMDIQAVGDTS